jgi:DNA-binding XRE family transcriptional regulator
MSDLSQLVKQYRKAWRMSQSQLAEHWCVSVRTIQNIEAGRTTTHKKMIAVLIVEQLSNSHPEIICQAL